MSPRPLSLQSRTLMMGRGDRYWAHAEGLPLSLKCMANGRARYTVGRSEFAVDDGGWLIVNEDQPYTIEIAAPHPVDTFIIWFPRGWAEEVWHGTVAPATTLLEKTGAGPEHMGFFERYTPNENVVAPRLRELRWAARTGDSIDDAWLEQKLRALLAGILDVQRDLRRAVARLPAIRAATREELWRRLNRARDYIHAHCAQPLQLAEMARVAAMSPYHFLRAFRSAFDLTPHDWLTHCRLERAKFLLARTDLPVTEVCLEVGYESLGTFGSRFQRTTGHSPRQWRQLHGTCRAIRNFEEVFPRRTVLSSAAFA